MSLVKNSVICSLLLSLWRGLTHLWRESLFRALFGRMGSVLHRGVEGSTVCRFLWQDGHLSRVWPDSWSCYILNAIVNLPCALLKTVYKAAKDLWDGSFFFRLAVGLGRQGAVLMGLLMLVMLVAPHDGWNNVYGFLGVVAVSVLFVVSTANSRGRLEFERVGPYLTFFFGFVCVAFITSGSTSLSLRFFLFHLTCLLIVLVLVSGVKELWQLESAMWLAEGGVFLAAIYGCYQGVVGVAVVASQQDMSVNAGMPGRIYSFFDNPNNFAEILVMLLPLLLALILNARSWRGRAAALICLAVGLVAIGYTYSRSGWLGLALAVFVFLALQNWRIVPFAIAAAVAVLPFLPETIYNRFLTIGNMQDSSTRYRFAIYEATGELMKDHWLKGVGLGSDVMTKTFSTYPTMFDGNHPVHTHNNYLQMFGELGILGGLSYLAVVFSQLKQGIKTFYASGDRRLRNLLAAAIGSFCGILLIGLAEYTWFYPRNMFFYWFLFGIIAACVKLYRQEK